MTNLIFQKLYIFQIYIHISKKYIKFVRNFHIYLFLFIYIFQLFYLYFIFYLLSIKVGNKRFIKLRYTFQIRSISFQDS